MLLDAKSGALWVRSAAPSGEPAEADRVRYVSEFSFDISKETQDRGPYVGDPKFFTGTSLTYEGSFSVDVPRAAQATLSLLLNAANDMSTKLWMRFREGEVESGSSPPSSALHTFTGVTITGATVSNDGETVTYEFKFTADGYTFTASTLT